MRTALDAEKDEAPSAAGGGATELVLLAARVAARDSGRACVMLSGAGVASEGVAAFLAALALLRLGTRETIGLLRPDASAPSRDESLLVGALAGLQCGAPWVAQRALAEWLPPDLAVRAIALLAKAAAALARAGLRVAPFPASPPRRGLA